MINQSQNATHSFLGSGAESLTVIEACMIAPMLALIVLVTIIGNIFVIFAILVEKDLRRPQYYLIWSLALADLMVGLTVTPIAALYELQRRWTLGATVCDLWITADVMVCTASILHLVAIALDRYWSVTDVTYMQRRTPKRILLMLSIVWSVALVLSIAPIFGWKDAEFHDRVVHEKTCLISQAISYQIFSTMTAFYLPLILIIAIYWRVFEAAKERLRRSHERKAPTTASKEETKFEHEVAPDPKDNADPTARSANGLATSGNNEVNVINKSLINRFDSADTADGGTDQLLPNSSAGSNQQSSGGAADNLNSKQSSPAISARTVESAVIDRKSTSADKTALLKKARKKKPKESAESKRERKAWRTLAIITGTFVGCWLPFFIVAIIRPMTQAQVPRAFDTFVLWLGYLNSAMNPIIYTIFSPDFRQAFQRMLRRLCFWN